jgi:hypothetical protein
MENHPLLVVRDCLLIEIIPLLEKIWGSKCQCNYKKPTNRNGVSMGKQCLKTDSQRCSVNINCLMVEEARDARCMDGRNSVNPCNRNRLTAYPWCNNSSLCLIKYHAMKTCRGVEVSPHILNLHPRCIFKEIQGKYMTLLCSVTGTVYISLAVLAMH